MSPFAPKHSILMLEEIKDMPQVLDQVKNLNLYVDQIQAERKPAHGFARQVRLDRLPDARAKKLAVRRGVGRSATPIPH